MPNILTETESRNIDMPTNRELIRGHFLKTISEEIAKDEKEKEKVPEEKIIQNKVPSKSVAMIKSTIFIQSMAHLQTQDEIILQKKENSFETEPEEFAINPNE